MFKRFESFLHFIDEKTELTLKWLSQGHSASSARAGTPIKNCLILEFLSLPLLYMGLWDPGVFLTPFLGVIRFSWETKLKMKKFLSENEIR